MANKESTGPDGHKYKLRYFDLWSRGEVLRWCFAYAQQPYNDDRIKLADWPALKDSMPFKQVPVLVVDDGKETISQQRAIGRYIANTHGFAGDDLLAQAKVDMYVDAVADLQSALDKPARSQKPEERPQLLDEFRRGPLSTFLDRFTRFLGTSEYLVGSKPTVADLFTAEILDRVGVLYDPQVLARHAALQQLVDRVRKLPGIAEHIADRKEKPMG